MTSGYEPDVTPVAGEAGSRAHRPGASFASGEDPFGAQPSRRRRGWVRIVLGTLLLAGGIVVVALGVVQAIEHRQAIDDEAVVRGTVSADDGTRPLAFRVSPGERQRYTVYLLFDGLTSNSEVQELAVRDTGCMARMPDGVVTRFRGARQTVAETIGDAASVGTFTSLPGAVAVLCTYTTGTRGSRRQRPDAIPYVVIAGGQGLTTNGVLAVIGGIGAGLAGGWLLTWGLIGRRRRIRVPQAGAG